MLVIKVRRACNEVTEKLKTRKEKTTVKSS